MDSLLFRTDRYPEAFLRPTVDYILSQQQPDGSIPWFVGEKLDPWDHVESAMALSIAGERDAAERAYQWLADTQLEDGSWYANYLDGEPEKCEHRETNFVAYIAVGVWHHYLINQDTGFLQRFAPVVQSAVEFVLRYQSAEGEIYWAAHSDGRPAKDALVTGCSSVLKSLECAINIFVTLGEDKPAWRESYDRLLLALRDKPERFDRTWPSKERFSMNWFYPILAGVYQGSAARARIAQRWDTFVREDMGCLCVSDEPWVAVAESCELTMALLAAGERNKAIKLYSWLHQWRDPKDGAYWTGYQYELDIYWPEEKPTWTAAAILLAADALTGHTAASRLLLEVNILDASGEPEDAEALPLSV